MPGPKKQTITPTSAMRAARQAKLVDVQRKLAEVVKDGRKASGLTQTSLATLSGTSRRLVCRVEKGNGRPTLGALVGLAYALDRPVSALLP